MKTWLTVKQVAEYLQLSTMMVYKLAQTGQIPAAKIGSAWRFDRDEVDKWLALRAHAAPSKEEERRVVPEQIKALLHKLAERFRDDFKGRFKKLILYGSWARGTATLGSDVDCLILLTRIDNYANDLKRAMDAAYSVGFDHEPSFVITPIIMEEKEYEEGMNALLINIRREGVEAA